MTTDAVVRARIDGEVKAKAVKVLGEMPHLIAAGHYQRSFILLLLAQDNFKQGRFAASISPHKAKPLSAHHAKRRIL